MKYGEEIEKNETAVSYRYTGRDRNLPPAHEGLKSENLTTPEVY